MDPRLAELLSQAPPYPRRIVCMTEETTEVLYRIGAAELVVGVSGFTVRPKEARQKPKISTFLDANFKAILALKPDLVLGFSDLQAVVARELIQRGVPVVVFNQRSVAEILQTVRVVGALVGRAEATFALAAELEAHLARHADAASARPCRPRVFFEEWHDPLIAGIRWCSELIEIAGGDDVCRESRQAHAATGRIYDPSEIARRNPDVVVASWCGKKAKRALMVARPGWAGMSAVENGQLYELKSSVILQPGIAALTEGIDDLAEILSAVARGQRLSTKSASLTPLR
jgi:iron complex transport system substrate-binding protein